MKLYNGRKKYLFDIILKSVCFCPLIVVVRPKKNCYNQINKTKIVT